MCTTLILRRPGEEPLYIDGLRDLEALIGRASIVMDPDDWPPDGEDCCLCPVDMEASAVLAGCRQVEADEDFPFGPVWEPADDHQQE